MKTYIYTYRRLNNDRNNNPRHWIKVYRMVRNQPVPLTDDDDEVAVG